jgi:quinol monooxygenase YgiN
MGGASRQEAGVVAYATHVDPENLREFFIYEKHHDIGGLEAHQETAHLKQLVLQTAIPLLESRVRRQFIDFLVCSVPRSQAVRPQF